MDSFMKWHMYANEDNLEGNDRIYNKFLDIYVLDPRTTIKKGRAVYTDYAIHVKTNHPEFAIKESCVRRRYSDFVWLENRLSINDVMMTVAPSLPGKRYFGRFKCQFLQKRQLGLQNFLNKVVEVNSFLYEPALHLFLQTDLSISHMENILRQGVHLSNARDRIIALHKYRENKQKAKDMQCRSISENSMKRTFSLDSFTTSMSKVEEVDDSNQDGGGGGGGRGWSRYIGERTWKIATDHDVTDFAPDSGSPRFRRHSLAGAPTACVMPGGRLRLADDDSDDLNMSGQSTSLKKTLKNKRSHSWHGTTNDVVDLLLDNYDIVETLPNESVISELGSDTLSNTSGHSKDNSSSSGVWQEASIDDGIQVDINQKLAEYAIVPMPPEKLASHISLERLCHSSFPGFHHSLSYSSDGS